MGTFTVKLPNGNTQEVPAEQMTQYGFQPAQVSNYIDKFSQPAASLKGTELGNTGQQIQNTEAAATLLPKIQTTTANAAITQQEADKQKAFNDTQALFDKSLGGDKKVSPDTYNKALNDASKYMTSDDFNARFQEPYTNPNNVFYNTPEAIKVRQSLPQIGNIVKSYSNLTKNGPNWEKLTQIPILGDYFKKVNFGDEIAHDAALKGTAAEILKTAGAGAGSTIRGNLAELAQVTGMLPLAADSRETANAKLDKLDNFLQKTYGTSLKDWLK